MNQPRFRKLSQLASLASFTIILVVVIALGKHSIHSVCPYAIVCFGALKGNLFTFAVGFATLGIVLGLGFMILAMYHGRVFCGYICPLGTVQELIYRLRGKKKRSQIIPYHYEKRLSRFKYVVLSMNLVLASWGLGWIYINFCPIYAISRLSGLALGGLIVFVLILIGAFLLDRIFCRYFCPYAALLNLTQKLGGILGIKRRKVLRNLERCVDCGMCNVYCPMNLNLLSDEYVQTEECIHCLRCAEKCPKKGTISCQEEK